MYSTGNAYNTRNMELFFLVLILAVGNVQGTSDLTFAFYYGDHMVLQKGPQTAVVWGYAKTLGSTVHVAINGTEVATTTVVNRPDGQAGSIWKVKLPARSSHVPVTIAATSSDGTATLHDVIFGDVWVCSGQSNMYFNMAGIANHTQEMHRATTYPNIRFMKAERVASNTSLLDLKSIATQWTKPKFDVKLQTFSAVCLLYAMNLYDTLHRPIGLVETSWGGTPIEDWSSEDVLKTCPATGSGRKRATQGRTQLWNAMVKPLLNMTVYGAIWYQGEANSGHASEYSCLFPAMIDDWREKFHLGSDKETNIDFPFGFVQLAPSKNITQHVGFPFLRWAQTANYGFVPNARLQNVFMAVAMDLPDFNSPYGSIHPRDKQDVADRLALAARAVAYGEAGLSYKGPIPTSYREDSLSHTLTVEFDHGNNPIEVRSNRGFQVCCGHTASECLPYEWYDVTITHHDVSSVTLNTTVCHGWRTFLNGVRYSWETSPCDFKHCSIYGRDIDLPATPFIYNGDFAHV